MQLHSENINEIACALAKAQSEITAPEKDKKNPHFKNSYSSLGSIISSCKKALNNNGISVLQPLEVVNGEFVIATMLTHTGGQWIKSIAPIKPVKNDPQSFGSALTYMKRYSLASMLCIDADEDDDGNEACKPATQSIHLNKDTKSEKISENEAECLEEIFTQPKLEQIKIATLSFCEKKFGKPDLKLLTRAAYESVLNQVKACA